MDFLSRRTIRKFKEKEVEKEVVMELMKTALVSPSGRNRKPYEFVVIDDKEIIKKLSVAKESGATFAADAPLMIVILGHENPTWDDDCAIASTIIQLKAHDLGLGSCWIQTKEKVDSEGNATDENIKKILGAPSELKVHNMMALGYPDEEKPAYTDADVDMAKLHFNKF
ncbi:nitroreductase [Fusobacterium sp. PH5-7]|uniref:nitroreductase family protein n=1 Tax=Fusobacterium sp. PH5-7 TaxID=2940528 RepID=UPI0024770D45|nr:nitroreductase family protein [Fusobacterium sp. PH5-7]MDH6457718.1 nitroreductase [Fusobacterium sp. PH5-7]